MKKILFIIFICTIIISCTPAKFIVIDKKDTGVFDNCIYDILPINKPAEQLFMKDGVFDVMDATSRYNVKDTIILDRKHYTNF